MCAFIDFQGFTDESNRFIIKELAIMKDEFHFKNFLFESQRCFETLPFKVQKQIRWLTRNYHGLEYDVGNVAYNKMSKILSDETTDVEVIYVKAVEKCNEIRRLLPTKIIRNLEDLGCPPFKSLEKLYLRHSCEHHQFPHSTCSLQNVKNCYLWKNEYCGDRETPEDSYVEEAALTCSCFCRQ